MDSIEKLEGDWTVVCHNQQAHQIWPTARVPSWFEEWQVSIAVKEHHCV